MTPATVVRDLVYAFLVGVALSALAGPWWMILTILLMALALLLIVMPVHGRRRGPR